MRSAAKKSSLNDQARQKHAAARLAPKVPSVTPLVSPVSDAFIQQKSSCACGGGCQRCQGRLPLQAKLRIGASVDKYEQEADRMADQVIRMPEPDVQRQENPEEEEELIQSKPLAGTITPLVQRQGSDQEEVEESILTKATTGARPEVTSAIRSDIHALQGRGRPLSRADRNFFEPRFGTDFSSVRVHNDSRAASAAQAINALAFTFGRNVAFGAGRYEPTTAKGRTLLAHELTHVVQQRGTKVLARAPGPTTQQRQDVVIIVGRPSMTTKRHETRQEKENMAAWRAAARAFSSTVFEGLTVDKAFAGLRKLRKPIGKLYIIGHADSSGFAEIKSDGTTVATTVADLTKRIKRATGSLGNRAPQSVEMLSCFGGGSPKTMGRIGRALGASTVRAPVRTTVISGRILKINGRKLTKARIRRLTDSTLRSYIKQTDAVKYYDFVPGVPHPQAALSKTKKLKALVGVLRKTGMIPFAGFNAEPGKREAVPYWKAPVEHHKASEVLSDMERASQYLGSKGVIEVTVRP